MLSLIASRGQNGLNAEPAESGRTQRTLLQFPISHYCEKTRWNLDAKGLAYRTRDLLPGLHRLVARRAAGIRTVPILVDGDRAIGNSHEIAMYLDETYSMHPLLPSDERAKREALEQERDYDSTLGPAVRQFAYALHLRERGDVGEAFFRSYSVSVRWAGRFMGPLLSRTIRKEYGATPESIPVARAVIVEAAERIERRIAGDPSRYLVGDGLTIADITAASLLAPIVSPTASPWEPSAELAEMLELRDALLARPCGQWVIERYRRDRRRVAS
jgi:glutathione S-transferase